MAKTKVAVKKKTKVEIVDEKVVLDITEGQEEAKVETQPEPENLIDRIYLIKKTGIEMLEGEDAEVDIKAIIKAGKKGEDGDTPYKFYEAGEEVYIAIKNGYYSPLKFPEPGEKPEQTGMTAMKLYGLGVTFPLTIERIIELETEPKPSLIDQARKIMTPTLVIVASILAIFLLVVIMKG